MPDKRKVDVIDELLEDARIRWEAIRRHDDYKREYGELRLDLSNKDLKAIRRVASNPHEIFTHGNLFIVSFCELWGVRYPKHPDDAFNPDWDSTLFYEYQPVRILPDYSVFKALGAETALQIIGRYLERSPLSMDEDGKVKRWYDGLSCEKDRLLYAEAVKHVQRIYQGVGKYAQKKREAGELMFLVKANYSKDVISNLIEQELDSFKKQLPKKRRRISGPTDDPCDLFKVWDVSQAGYYDTEIGKVTGFHGSVSSFKNWRKRAEALIARAGQRRDARRDKDGKYLCWGDFR